MNIKEKNYSQMQKYIPCNLCGSRNEKLLYVVFDVRIVRCQECGLVYVNPRHSKDKLVELYDYNYFENIAYRINDEAQYFGYNEYINDEENIMRKFQRKIEIIEKLAKVGDLLDVGCACGFFMKLASSRGWRVEGIEPSRFASEHARERFNFTVHNAFLEDVRYPDNYFDAITMWDVIEHLSDPLGSLFEVNRIMKRAGVLGIITPNIDSFLARVLGRNWLEIKRVKEHIYFFSYKTLAEMLLKANFKIRYVHTSGKFVKLKTIISELNFMHWPMADRLSRWIQNKKWGAKSFYIDPGYKMAVYAVKTGPVKK